jgi:glutamyl-tRNA synthetase
MPFDVIRTRIAPSPTGIAHVGTLDMALFNYAFAKQNGGQFIVRSEDTDRARFVEGAEQVVLDCLKWAGITPDEDVERGGPFGPYRQSERLDIYKKYVQQLLDEGKAYYCFATSAELQAMREAQMKASQPPRYDGRYRDYPLEESKKRIANGESYVVRMRVPPGETTWNDLIRGPVTISHEQIDDQVILKSDGYPTYHLAVVVDDHLMKISHVMRGEEWISSTPKHIILYNMFGWEIPEFAHMPLLRNPDKSKLSKRKNDVSVVSYQQKGYLAEALLNFLMLLGWSHPDKKEIISLEEFVHDFTFDHMQKTGPVFDTEKLNWMNGKYIREIISTDALKEKLIPFVPADFPMVMLDSILPLIRERLVTLADFEPLTCFFYRDIVVDNELLLKKADAPLVQQQLQECSDVLGKITDWKFENIENALRSLQEERDWKKSQFFMMIRVAVTGEKATPPLFQTMEVLGQQKTLERLLAARAL